MTGEKNKPDLNLIRICTANVGSLCGRSREVTEMLGRRNADVCCIQETQYKGNGCKILGDGDERYKLWWSGEKTSRGGVGILVRDRLIGNVIQVERPSAAFMKVKMVFEGKVFHIYSVYAPQTGRSAAEKDDFWDSLEDDISSVPLSEPVWIAGDLNGHVGADRRGFEDVMGPHGFGERNSEGERILTFYQGHGMLVMNTKFHKGREKLITYKSGDGATQIDYMLLRQDGHVTVRDVKCIPGEACLTQHRLLVMDVHMQQEVKAFRKTFNRKLKVWKLKDEETRRKFEEVCQQKNEAQSEIGWDQLQCNVIQAVKQVFGETRGRPRQVQRETWWWSCEVQRAIKNKKLAFKRWQKSKTDNDRKMYKDASKLSKKAVAKAREESWQTLSRNISKTETQNKMFRIARQMKTEGKDVVQGNFVKSETGEILVEEADIKIRWKEYFEGLLNKSSNFTIDEPIITEGPTERVTEEEVRSALCDMKNGRAPGPSGLSVELLKGAGEDTVMRLVTVFQEAIDSGGLPSQWQRSLTIPIYKGRGDSLECGNYRGIRLLEHGMKLFEKVIERRLRKLISIDCRQFGFRRGKSTTDAVFILRQLQEKYSQKKKKLYHVFVDLEKAFDRVPREIIEWALRRQGVPERLVSVVMSMYRSSRTQIVTKFGLSEELDVGMGVHQGSALSPLLFITVMEEASKDCRGSGPWELLYADDLVLTAASKQEAIDMFSRWKDGLERRGLKINGAKSKVMVTGKSKERTKSGKWPCSCCGRGVGANSIFCVSCKLWCHKKCSRLRSFQGITGFRCPKCADVPNSPEDDSLNVNGIVLQEVQDFCYLGDVVDSEASAEGAVRTRIAASWTKWRELASLLTNKGIPLKCRAHVYEMCVRSVLIYGAETWPLSLRLVELLRSTDRRMLRYMAKVRLKDKVTSEEVARRCGLPELPVRLRQRRLRWFGHVRRANGDVINEVYNLSVDGCRPPGRPKTWQACIHEDLESLEVSEDTALDRSRWKRVIASTSSPGTGKKRRKTRKKEVSK